MHPNPAFRAEPRERNIAFARERAFGTLSANGEAGPLVSHVPFLLSEDGTVLETHLVRSTPLSRSLPAQAVMAVAGPDAYISPDWYEMDDQVPTWNYVAVHLRGRLEARPADELRALLERQSAEFEERLLPKRPWTLDKMPTDLVERLMRAIVPVRMQVESVEGTWKLAQNKPGAARLAAARQLETFGRDPEARLLTALMKGLGES